MLNNLIIKIISYLRYLYQIKIEIMKKFLFLFSILLAGVFQSLNAQAVIKFDKTTHNFGTFSISKPQTVTFSFTNTGDKPLVIQQAFSSCGCTVADFTKQPIEPGKKGEVKVTYDGKNTYAGPFKKPVTVRSNASNSLVRIYIEGTTQDDK